MDNEEIFKQGLTLRDLRARLLEGMPLLDTALDEGLSSSSRVLDLVLTVEGERPRQIQLKGGSLTLTWGVGTSLFGRCVAAHSGWGLTTLLFVCDETEALEQVRHDWPHASLVRDDARAQEWIDQAFAPASRANLTEPWRLHVRGTHFQLKVWQALLQIPENGLVTYGMLADCVGSPKAARAVGQAVGANPLAYLIPCHRVIHGSGTVGHYRGGHERKCALLAWEAALAAQRK